MCLPDVHLHQVYQFCKRDKTETEVVNWKERLYVWAENVDSSCHL